jgi:hypothetical protein
LEIAGQSVTISQQGVWACSSSINPTSAFVPSEGATSQIAVTVNAGECLWNARSDVPWIFLTGDTATGGGVLAVVRSAARRPGAVG